MSDLIPTPKQQAKLDIVDRICEGRPDARLFIHMVWDFAMAWDHVVDNDPVDMPTYNRAMKNILINLPLNDFFISHRASLIPVMSNFVSAWEASNEDGMSKLKAHDIYVELPCAVAFVLGGTPLVDKYIPELRRISQLNCEEDDLKDGGKK